MGEIRNFSYYNVITWNKNGFYRRYPLNLLNLEFGTEEYDYLLFLKFENHYQIPNISDLIASLQLIYNESAQTFVVLTPRKEPPPYTATEEEFVFSFSCPFQYFKKVVAAISKTTSSSNELLFELLDQITTTQTELEQILIRQFPFEVDKSALIQDCDVIIPHMGDNEYLSSVLSFLALTKGTKIYVGIDQPVTKDIIKLKAGFPGTAFYNFTPNPVGPYVIRNRLIDRGNSELIFFQDSDDIPCTDRFGKISEFIKNSGCQLCGSHELRMDYYNRTVQAVRFPLDVVAALKLAPWHSLLHPASAIERKAFYECEGLSEERTFGNDTKFLLRSYFTLNEIANINEFLYIRKRHSGSLTTSPDTMLESPVRQKLLHHWNSDFEKIKSGILNVAASSLPQVSTNLIFKIERL